MSDAAQEVESKQPDVELPSLDTRIEWVEDWDESTSKNRKLASRDRAYYDNDQWTADEIKALEERHQPVLTKNRIARKVNYILGEEIKKRVNPAARPRTPQHEDSAKTATDALRFVADQEKFDRVSSAVLKNMIIEGMGGSIKEITQDDDGEIKHQLQHVEWDRLFYDPHSRANDFGDAKYLGIILWMDLDDAIIDYPDAADALKAAVQKGRSTSSESTDDAPRGWVDSKRKRVKIAEMYFRVGDNWYRSCFTEAADLTDPALTEFKDEKGLRSVCPLKMESCYVDQDGNRYGVVRQLISPQDEINKRSSKALHQLNTVSAIAERDTVRDPQKFLEELAKPDGFAEVEPGALSPDMRIQIRSGADLAMGQVQLMQQAQQDIDSIGPSSAMVADMPNSMSGRAFLARAQSASQELGTVFDNHKEWRMAVFALDWLCIRQWMTQDMWLRVTDDQEMAGYRFTRINGQMKRLERMQELLKKGAPQKVALDTAAGEFAPLIMGDVQRQAQQMAAAQAQQAQAMGGQQPPAPPPPIDQLLASHPLMQEMITTNQVDRMLVDIVLDEAPDTAVIAQEEFDTLGELMPTIVQARPDMGPVLARMMIKASQMPNKRDLLAELEKGPDPQQQAAQRQAQELQQAMQKAGLNDLTAATQLKQAQAAKAQTEAQMLPEKTAAQSQRDKAQAMDHAASAGQKSVPQIQLAPGDFPQ